jgi:hypothetical protein
MSPFDIPMSSLLSIYLSIYLSTNHCIQYIYRIKNNEEGEQLSILCACMYVCIYYLHIIIPSEVTKLSRVTPNQSFSIPVLSSFTLLYCQSIPTSRVRPQLLMSACVYACSLVEAGDDDGHVRSNMRYIVHHCIFVTAR